MRRQNKYDQQEASDVALLAGIFLLFMFLVTALPSTFLSETWTRKSTTTTFSERHRPLGYRVGHVILFLALYIVVVGRVMLLACNSISSLSSTYLPTSLPDVSSE